MNHFPYPHAVPTNYPNILENPQAVDIAALSAAQHLQQEPERLSLPVICRLQDDLIPGGIFARTIVYNEPDSSVAIFTKKLVEDCSHSAYWIKTIVCRAVGSETLDEEVDVFFEYGKGYRTAVHIRHEDESEESSLALVRKNIIVNMNLAIRIGGKPDTGLLVPLVANTDLWHQLSGREDQLLELHPSLDTDKTSLNALVPNGTMTDDMTRSFLLVAKGLGSPHVLIPISSNLSIPLNGFPSEKSKPMSKPKPKPSTNTDVVSDTSKATTSNDKEVSPESLISDNTDVITTTVRNTRSKVNDANKSVFGGVKPVTDEEDKEEDTSNKTKENNRDEEVKASTTAPKSSSKKRKSSNAASQNTPSTTKMVWIKPGMTAEEKKEAKRAKGRYYRKLQKEREAEEKRNANQSNVDISAV